MMLLIVISFFFFLSALVFYIIVFVNRPRKLKNLNNDISTASDYLKKINDDVAKISADYNAIKKDYEKFSILINELKIASDELSHKIDVQNANLKKLAISKDKYEDDIENLSIKLNEINSGIEYSNKKQSLLSSEIGELRNQKFTLGLELDKLKKQIEPLRTDTQALLERKFDLEQENTHLSKEIIKKKISYRNNGEDLIKLVKYINEPEVVSPTKTVSYVQNSLFSSTTYPSVFIPSQFTKVQFARKGRVGQRGFTEPAFEEDLKTYFLRQRNFQLYSDRFLFVSNGTKPYEPDFTIIDESANLNLFINVEIDEPYDGWSRCATHFQGQDDNRNKFFTDRGWLVIRFSEKQIHLNPKGCCRFICEVIKSVNNNFIIPSTLMNAEALIIENYWSKVQSEKWQKEKYREKYLGIEAFVKKAKTIIDPSELIGNENEKEIVGGLPLQPADTLLTGSINNLNKHQRDTRIQFFPEPHLYIIDENPNTISVSTLVKSFFQDFDSEYWSNRNALKEGLRPEQLLDKWERNRQESANQGTELHLNIEQFFEDKKIPDNKIEFNHFINLYNSELKQLKAYRTEWRIFDDLLYVAGTVDMVFKKYDGTYAIYDWKRSKEIKKTNSYNNGFGPCATLQDCNYNHYCLQINFYKKILEDHYAKPISEMKMVQLHPNFDNYQIYDVPDMQNAVNEIYEALM